MKKVLILAYDFPPYVSVGALRPYSWYKYLHEFDVYPIVVTRQWGNKYGNHLDYVAPGDSNETLIEETEKGSIIRAPYIPNLSNRLLLKYGNTRFTVLRKAITAAITNLQWIFPIGPKYKLYKAAKLYLKSHKVDLIIATGEPFILFKYAHALSKKFDIPWIADYRDPWSQDKVRKARRLPSFFNKYFEKKYLYNVTAISTVSVYCQGQISQLISEKPFYIFPNGFDSEAIDLVSDVVQADDVLNIAFVGTIYKWHPLDIFLRTCQDLVNEKGLKFNINFYGINIETELLELLDLKYSELKQYISIFPKLSNDVLLRKLTKNQVFLLFNDYLVIGTKIYDYLALRRKIILCFTHDKEADDLKKAFYSFDESSDDNQQLQAELIETTQSGIAVKDSMHLKEVLTELNDEFSKNRAIACNSINTDQFSRKIQAQKLAEIIKTILH